MNFSKRLLTGDGWKLQLVNFKSDTAADKKGEIPIKELRDETPLDVIVPGEVHMDLFKHGLIPDLYIGEKELEYRWIPDSDWKYSKEFKVTRKELNQYANIDLVCEGIDTVADVFINGIKLDQKAENMFRVYRFKDIKKLLVSPPSSPSEESTLSSLSSSLNGEGYFGSASSVVVDEDEEITNNIEIIIYSPSKYAKDAAKAYQYPVPEWEYPNGIHHRNFIRKCACHFSWDWGCCFCPMGIYLPLYLEFYSIPLIKQVSFRQNHKNNPINHIVELDVTVKFYTSSVCSSKTDTDIPINVSISHVYGGGGNNSYNSPSDHHQHHHPLTITSSSTSPSSSSSTSPRSTTTTTTTKSIEKQFIVSSNQLLLNSKYTFSIEINDAKLWWPLGHGEQNLYDVVISMPADYQIKKTIGLRTAKVDTSKDMNGNKFQIVVNGVAIFAKGADWIPADHFLTRITKEKYHYLLSSAKMANMNCLRVWGGGIYEDDYFYDLCNRFGIMLWQDLMFGCALYPTNKEFLKNVKKEIKCQIVRIGSHPSIVLWCGSNESEQAIVEKLWEPIKENPQRYTVDFNRLYIEVIMKILAKQLPDSFFWTSSPSNGVGEWGDPNDCTRGDTHYWAVWHSDMPFTQYLKSKGRFLSEFGFQSLPSFSELKKVLSSPDQLNITSPEMEGRQRSPTPGNIGILKHIGLHFRVPLDFEYLCYTSQILQAISIKTGCEHWRRLKPFCMGTLYWQLNDIWCGPSWSGIEFNGNWKPLHYFAKKFYQPILLSFAENLEEPNLLEVWLTHDYDGLENIYLQSKLLVQVWDLNTSRVVNTIETIVSVVLSDKHQFSKRVLSTSRDKLFSSLPLSPNNYIVTCFLDCSVNAMKSSNQTMVSKFLTENYNDISNTFYPFEFKKLNLKQTKVHYSINNNVNGGLGGTIVEDEVISLRDSNKRIAHAKVNNNCIFINQENKSFEFTIESTELALFVWIQCSNYSSGYYSDNGFNLFKHRPKTISYFPQEFNSNILPEFSFTSLRDTY